MTKETSISFIKKIQHIQKEVSVSKDATNPFFKNSYITLDNILEKVNPLLEKYNISIINENQQGGVSTTLYDIDSKEFRKSVFIVEGIKDPQKLGSCITYGRRYNLVSLLNIVADDDKDGNDFNKCIVCKKECRPGKKYCGEECFKKSQA